MPLEIVVDTREKGPWVFQSYKDVHVQQATLKTGDYSVLGLEKAVCVERKASVSEWSANLTGAGGDRFRRELDRMTTYEESHVVLCFSLDDLLGYPQTSGLSPYIIRKIKAKGPYLLKLTLVLMADFPSTRFHFAGNEKAGQALTAAILKRFVSQRQTVGVSVRTQSIGAGEL